MRNGNRGYPKLCERSIVTSRRYLVEADTVTAEPAGLGVPKAQEPLTGFP